MQVPFCFWLLYWYLVQTVFLNVFLFRFVVKTEKQLVLTKLIRKYVFPFFIFTYSKSPWLSPPPLICNSNRQKRGGASPPWGHPWTCQTSSPAWWDPPTSRRTCGGPENVDLAHSSFHPHSFRLHLFRLGFLAQFVMPKFVSPSPIRLGRRFRV